MLRILLLIMSFLASAIAAKAETLTIYTYDSFASDWGPGIPIAEGFAKQCECEINWNASADAAFLLSLLKTEGSQTEADIILGLDTNLMAEAIDSGMVATHATTAQFNLPITWDNPYFVPYDFGYFAVMVDTEMMAEPPQSLEELVKGDYADQLVIQDPRTSTPGLGLLHWMYAVYGDEMDQAWQDIKSNILTTTPGWSEAYGLFLGGSAPMVLSYTTSQAYHEMVEETSRYQALIFPEGHQIQVEVAGISAYSDQKELAQQFLDYLVSSEAQTILPKTNWMYPAVDIGDSLPATIQNLPVPSNSYLLDSETAGATRTALIDIWLTSLIQ